MSAAAGGALLRHPPFALSWFARVFSSGALHMQAVAIGWQVYAMTDSALALGLVGLAQFAPMVVLTLLVGQIADHYSRRTIALNALFVGTSNQLGEFESGVTAALFGVVPAVLIGGAGTILVALGWMRLFPELRAIDRLPG